MQLIASSSREGKINIKLAKYKAGSFFDVGKRREIEFAKVLLDIASQLAHLVERVDRVALVGVEEVDLHVADLTGDAEDAILRQSVAEVVVLAVVADALATRRHRDRPSALGEGEAQRLVEEHS